MAFGHAEIHQRSLLLYQMDIYSAHLNPSTAFGIPLKYFLSLTSSIKHTSVSFDSSSFPSSLNLDIPKDSFSLFHSSTSLFLSPSLYKGPKLNLSSFSSNHSLSLAASAFLIFPNFVPFSLPLLLLSRL